MSSLLQFNGQASRRGVQLRFNHEKEQPPGVAGFPYIPYEDSFRDGIYLPGGRFLPRIYTAWRKPRGMFGCWVVFRYNGEDQVPDLSCPIGVTKLPRDYEVPSITETIRMWES